MRTPEQLTACLDLILAKCQEVGEVGEKMTKGPWQEDTAGIFIGGKDEPIARVDRYHDASGIALFRNLTPGIARMLEESIAALKDQQVRHKWEQNDDAGVVVMEALNVLCDIAESEGWTR